MKICLISSSFYPATFYGGPISATWDLSKKLAEKGNEIFVSTALKGMSKNEIKKYKLSGSLFKIKTNIKGIQPKPFKI